LIDLITLIVASSFSLTTLNYPPYYYSDAATSLIDETIPGFLNMQVNAPHYDD